MSIKGQGHSLTLVKGNLDFKVKCLTFGLYNQVSDLGPQGPLVFNLKPFYIQQSLRFGVRGLTDGFLLLRNFSVTVSVSPHVCFIIV